MKESKIDVGLYSPSYKRPQKSTTQIMYPDVTLVVRESEAEEYRENGNRIVVCPDSAQGNVCRVKNWMLDNLLPEHDAIVFVDDDSSGFGYWEHQKWLEFTPTELNEFIEQMAILTKDYGFYHFGINCVVDKGAYREYTPFSTLNFIGSPFAGHMKGTELYYDENLSLKEDYDMTLQHVHRYGGCLRANYASYKVKQSEQAGGCATYRNLKTEKKQFKMLQKKWGADVVRQDKGSKRSFDYNPVLKIPIRGV